MSLLWPWENTELKEWSRINKCRTSQSIPATSAVKLSRVKVNLLTHILMWYCVNNSNLCSRGLWQWVLTAHREIWLPGTFLDGHLYFVGGWGVLCICSWWAAEAGFQASWTSDLIRSGIWCWLGRAPRALPRAGPAAISAAKLELAKPALGLASASVACLGSFEVSPKLPALPWKTPPVLS